MGLELLDSLLSVAGKVIAIAITIGSVCWAAHKFWLSNVFLTKKEFKTYQVDFETRFEHKIGRIYTTVNDQKDQTKTLEKEFAVFKASYMGDMALLKEQLNHANEINKQILHRVNNMASVDIKNVLSDIIDDKLRGK